VGAQTSQIKTFPWSQAARVAFTLDRFGQQANLERHLAAIPIGCRGRASDLLQAYPSSTEWETS